MPEHAHLFGEFGCYHDTEKGTIINRECGTALNVRQKKDASRETKLDPAFYPIELGESMDRAWYDIVRANINAPEEAEKTAETPETAAAETPEKTDENAEKKGGDAARV